MKNVTKWFYSLIVIFAILNLLNICVSATLFSFGYQDGTSTININGRIFGSKYTGAKNGWINYTYVKLAELDNSGVSKVKCALYEYDASGLFTLLAESEEKIAGNDFPAQVNAQWIRFNFTYEYPLYESLDYMIFVKGEDTTDSDVRLLYGRPSGTYSGYENAVYSDPFPDQFNPSNDVNDLQADIVIYGLYPDTPTQSNGISEIIHNVTLEWYNWSDDDVFNLSVDVNHTYPSKTKYIKWYFDGQYLGFDYWKENGTKYKYLDVLGNVSYGWHTFTVNVSLTDYDNHTNVTYKLHIIPNIIGEHEDFIYIAGLNLDGNMLIISIWFMIIYFWFKTKDVYMTYMLTILLSFYTIMIIVYLLPEYGLNEWWHTIPFISFIVFTLAYCLDLQKKTKKGEV